MVKNLIILLVLGIVGYFGFKMWKKRPVKVPADDKLTEAEKQGLITHEEFLRLKYDRAKERYDNFLKQAIKKSK